MEIRPAQAQPSTRTDGGASDLASCPPSSSSPTVTPSGSRLNASKSATSAKPHGRCTNAAPSGHIHAHASYHGAVAANPSARGTSAAGGSAASSPTSLSSAATPPEAAAAAAAVSVAVELHVSRSSSDGVMSTTALAPDSSGEEATGGNDGEDGEDEQLEPALRHISILAHIAIASIIGVGIRYGLEILFGPTAAHVTDDWQSLFLDVPANMFGSFIMGIVGVVAKKDIMAYSEPLAISIASGLTGSITSFASWNQRMVAIAVGGLWVRALFGYIVGTAVSYYSLLVGVDFADGVRALIERYNMRRVEKGLAPWQPTPDNFTRRWVGLGMSVVLALLLFISCTAAFALTDDVDDGRVRKAMLACMVAPLGCWARWYLSWLNGGGVGKQQRWKWLPVGTVTANIVASTLDAVTSIIDLAYNTRWGSIAVGGLQLGFMGCLSTVSALMAELYLMSRAKSARWRGYVYLYLLTILPSFVLGIICYGIPVWVLDLYSSYNTV